jgi:hypothetical protein
MATTLITVAVSISTDSIYFPTVQVKQYWRKGAESCISEQNHSFQCRAHDSNPKSWMQRFSGAKWRKGRRKGKLK